MSTKSTTSSGNGLRAFLFGMLLSSFAWVANQGWTVLSLVFFGALDFSDTSNALKHLLFCISGAIATSVAWCSVFNRFFPGCEHDENEEEEGELNTSSYKRDVSRAIADLGELGFVTGYMGAQCLGIRIINATGNITVESDDDVSRMMILLLLVWVIHSKICDLNKATRRAKAFESANFVHEAYAYTQMA